MRLAPFVAACLLLASAAPARADSLGPYLALQIAVEANDAADRLATAAERSVTIHRGSGVVVGPAKSGGWLVLTNAHVVRAAGATGPQAWAAGGWRTGRVLGTDEAADLALLVVPSPEPLRIARIADAAPADGAAVKTRAFAGGTDYTARKATLHGALPLKDGREGRAPHTFFVDTSFVAGESGGAVVHEGRLVGLIYATDVGDETADSTDDRGWGLCVDHASIIAFLARFGRRPATEPARAKAMRTEPRPSESGFRKDGSAA